jgi:hypothetical protein
MTSKPEWQGKYVQQKMYGFVWAAVHMMMINWGTYSNGLL